MKKTIFFLSLYFALSGAILAQNNSWIWSTSAGTQDNEEGSSVMCMDGSNGTISAGHFSGSDIIFPSGMYSNVNPGFKDFYVVQYDQTGNIVWIKLGHGNKDEYITGICQSSNGNFFIAGIYTSDTLIMGNNTLVKPSGNNSDIFLAKLNSNGNVQWLKGFGGSSYEIAIQLESDFNGGVILSGNYFGNGFSIGSTVLDFTGGKEAFIARIDGSGNGIWAVSSIGQLDESISDFTVHPVNGIDFCGSFNSYNSLFATSGLYNTSFDSTSDLYYGNMDLQGNINFINSLTGVGEDNGGHIEIDPSGNILLAVYSNSDIIEFENSQITLDGGNPCVLLCEINQSNTVIWSQVLPCSGLVEVSGLELNPVSGNLYLALNYGVPNSQAATLTADSQQFTSQGYYDLFLSEWDLNGSLIEGQSLGGMFNEKWNSISLSLQTGWLHTTGYYESPTLFLCTYPLQNSGSHDAFTAVYGDVTTTASEEIRDNNNLMLFPNPSSGVVKLLNFKSGSKIEIFDSAGRIAQFSIHDGFITIHQKGIYSVKITEANRTSVKKLIIN